MRDDNPLRKQLQLAEKRIEHVANGVFVCAGISGPPGVGKTYLTESILTRLKKKYIIFNGTSPELRNAAYAMRWGGVIVIDDADGIVVNKSVEKTNLMKQLTDNKPTRLIRNYTLTARNSKDESDAPAVFKTSAGIIWLTNSDLDAADPAMIQHIQALKDRGLNPIRLSRDRLDILDYVLDLIIEKNVLQREVHGLSLNEAQEVVNWLCESVWTLETVSARMAIEAAKYRHHDPDNWREQMALELLPKPISTEPTPIPPILIPHNQRMNLAS